MIVCGPIVRHSNRTVLNLWLVLDQRPESIQLNTYLDDARASPVTRDCDAEFIPAGDNCYICMLSTDLPLDNAEPYHQTNELFYEIVLDGEPFGDSQLLATLCPGTDKLPSVYLPREHRHFIQASCRRPHSPGQDKKPDQLARGARLLAENLRKESRPSQLFLTGDQIYADDVSPLLLDYLGKLQKHLGLADDIQNLPAGKDLHRLSKLDDRHWVTRSPYGFSSSAKSSHLLTRAEYLSMYLFAFSGAGHQFGLDFAGHDELKPRLAKQPANTRDGRNPPVQYVYTERQHAEDHRNLSGFANLARSEVRQLLANTVTYMIFDDHEVTDDWNISKQNARQLSTTPIGRYVLINALQTYFLCQHWGNQPSLVKSEVAKLKTLLEQDTPADHKEWDWLLERYWGYELEQTPPVAVLDTRTHREFSKRGKHSLGLMSDQQIQQLGQRLSGFHQCRTLIVVSPTPTYGFSHIEYLQLNFPMFKRTLDREPWSADTASLEALKASCCQLPGVEHVVIFSGDVHYAFARRRQTSQGPVLWQICSSACNNVPMGENIGLRAINRIGELLGKNQESYLLPEDSDFFLTSDRNIGTLMLDDQGCPVQAGLLCAGENGSYQKRYDLVNYRETN